MRQFQFDRGPAGPMTVEVHDDRVVLHHQGLWNRQREVSFEDLVRIRFYKVSSPQREHWGVALVGSAGKETMEYVRGRVGHAASGPIFIEAVEALVSQMLEQTSTPNVIYITRINRRSTARKDSEEISKVETRLKSVDRFELEG